MRRRGYSRIYLIGFMGAGKTTVGRELAKKLGWSFLDLDREIERGEGKPISDIFKDDGEHRFRALEQTYLERFAARDHLVLALGGGAYVNVQNQRLVDATGVSVWLKVSFAKVMERVKIDGTRPMFGSDDETERLYQTRQSHYNNAKVHVLTDDRTPRAVAEEILGVIRKL